ncbi:MmgE/PrpD family protein [Microbacteriaceae bacterium K1510]|nr:MmgE/PrpD family protein [Microbacteriaceae bacterium K1510]
MPRTPNADAVSTYIAGTGTRTIPEPVLEAAHMCLVDWFGVAIAARDEGAAQVVRKVAGGRAGDAKVLFGSSTDEPYAALINGTMAHCLDFDDTHVGSLAHLSGPTWAAALAVGTAMKSDPGDILRGFVTGFEVGARIGADGFGDALNTRTLHSTGFCGSFAAAAAAAALYGLDAGQALNAIGAAATQASGLTGSFGTMSKPFHAGKAAFNGVLSAQLAKAGFVAAHDLIEAGTGLSTAMIQDRSRAIAPMSFAADDWEILRNTFKPYASCLLTHPVIDSARKAHSQIAGRAIDSVQVNVHPMAVQLAGNPAPQTPLQGKFSTAYCAALALRGRAAAASDFSVERVNDPDLRDLVARVRLNVVPEMEKTAASIVVTLADGSTIAADTPLALGNPGNPMQWEDLRSKFLGLVEPMLSQGADLVFDNLHHFGRGGDVETVFVELGSSITRNG